MREPMTALLVDVHAAAKLLSVSERTLWARTTPRGDIPCVKIGTLTRYDVADLRAWIQTNKKSPAATGESIRAERCNEYTNHSERNQP